MAPRHYSLGKRAANVAETRRRILGAAIALYQEKGISATSMQEVARRTDVAPGTVLNHFRTPDALAEAVIAQLWTDLRAPSEDMFQGLNTPEQRVSRLARELAGFYQRSEPWYRVHQREGGRSRVFAAAEVQFYELLDQLMRQALGPLATDERALAALRALMNPAVFGGLQAQGMSSAAAGDLVAEVLEPWLKRKLKESEGEEL